MIAVIATIELQPGRRDAFLAIFHRLVPTVLQEAGCLEYGPTVDLATDIAAQGPPRADTVVILEKWAGIDALKAHLTAPHMAAYRREVAALVTRVSLAILQPA